MENKIINLNVLAIVAEGLQELNKEMVFVGGAVISLYTDDVLSDEVRPTTDVDLTLKAYSYAKFEVLERRLIELGFSPNPFGHAMCSYQYKDIQVDIMPAQDSHFGPSNRWYKVGLHSIQKVQVKEQEVQILSAPLFLATKFEAFNDRGTDYRTSHDFEDIIFVLDNRLGIAREIIDEKSEAKAFLQAELKKLMSSPYHKDFITAHLSPIIASERYALIAEKIQLILK